MKNISTNIKSSALIGFLLTIPFVFLELINRRNFHEGFPVFLFVILWLLPTVFVPTLTPIVRDARAGNNILANPISLLLRVIFLILIASLWAGILRDQMPCFLGVPNCD